MPQTNESPELVLQELRSLEEVAAARDAWRDLTARVPSATPFQTWEWVHGFARYDRSRPRVLVLTEPGGRWLAVLPLCESSRIPWIRRLELIGGRLSDYPGLLVDPARRAACEARLRSTLGRLLDLGVMRSQPDNPPAWLPPLPYKVLATDESVVVTLPGNVEAFMQTLSAKFRSNLRRNQRRVEDSRIEFHTPTNERELRAAMPVLFELHQMRKNSQGERGRFYESRWREAITDIAVSLQVPGVTRLTILRIDDVPAAASFDLRLHATQFTYQYGMNPALKTYSPGKLLTLRMLEDAIGAGMQRYDFGRGMEEYKLQWSKQRRVVSDLIVARSPSILSTFALLKDGHSWLLRNRLLKKAYLTLRGRARPSPDAQAESQTPATDSRA